MDNFLDFKNGFYIEAGANDGVSQSNTLHLERDRGWKGLLIEPNKFRWAECLVNRSRSTNVIENCALVSFDHKEPTVEGNFEELGGESLMSQITAPLDYYDSHQLVAAEEKSKKKVVSVKARTLQSIIDQHKIDKIHFLSLDVEGYEEEAMRGLDFSKNSPTYIRVETSTFQYRKDRMTEFMKLRNYKFLGMSNENDCFYTLTN